MEGKCYYVSVKHWFYKKNQYQKLNFPKILNRQNKTNIIIEYGMWASSWSGIGFGLNLLMRCGDKDYVASNWGWFRVVLDNLWPNQILNELNLFDRFKTN